MCDREDKEAVRRAREAVRETFAVAVNLGGTISGEHGIGYVKAPYLEMAIDAPTVEAMKQIKRALDPNGILNPGKMFMGVGV
jgi:glycolate oxidase